MKHKLLILVFFIALALRFSSLGQIPSGFVNDEASFGYNAYSLIKTGKDEFGHSWPIIFQSFGDGKMPIYYYLTIPSVAMFGLNEFAVRFPSAFFGSLTTVLIYLLCTQLFKTKKHLALIASLIYATMPWSVHFSRVAFESNVALFFITLATWLFLIKKPTLSALSFSISIFTYHAPRLFVPLWLISLIILFRKQISLKKYLFIFFIFTFLPWTWLTFSKTSLNRASGITLLHQQSGISQRIEQKLTESTKLPPLATRLLHNKPIEYSYDIARRYLSHFDTDFLFFQGDPNRPRYRSPDVGQALLITWPFLLVGLVYVIKLKKLSIPIWLLLAPIPSAITFETPSAIRSLLMITPLSIIMAAGVYYSFALVKHRFFKLGIFLLFLFNLIYYLDAYFIHMPVHQPYEWQGGYKQLVAKVNQLMPEYNQAIITDARGTAYIYFLFFNKIDPNTWHQQATSNLTEPDKFGYQSITKLNNLYFKGGTCPANPKQWDQANNIPEEKTLYVCTEEHHPSSLILDGTIKVLDTIEFDDGQAAFVLMAKPQND